MIIKKIVLETCLNLIGEFTFIEHISNFNKIRNQKTHIGYDFKIRLDNEEYYNLFLNPVETVIKVYTEYYVYGPIQCNIQINNNSNGLIITWSANNYPPRHPLTTLTSLGTNLF